MIIGTYQAPPKQNSKQQKLFFDSDTEDDDKINDEPGKEAVGWAYVGSHNFTPSAWGNISGSAFNPVLNVS
jgi:tyrosyl-DNA phosphodiesterase 1